MGYTHYWHRPAGTGNRRTFQQLGIDAKRIIFLAKQAGIGIRDGYGLDQPVFNEQFFSFNGDAEARIENGPDTTIQDLSHETFFWSCDVEIPDWQRAVSDNDDTVFHFCKTAYKPYDEVVTAVLIRAKELYGDQLRVASDGSWSDWADGRKLYERAFGRKAECPFTSEGVSL